MHRVLGCGLVLTEEFVGFGVAGGELDILGGGSGMEKSFDGFCGAAVLPVRVGCGADGELESGVSLAVECVDGGSACDEEFYGGGVGSPCGYVEGGAVSGDVVVAIPFVEGSGAYTEVEELAGAFGVSVAGELGEESSAFVDELRNEAGVTCCEGADGFGVVLRAGGDELVEWSENDGDAALFEEIEYIAAAPADSDEDC